jgi:Ca-activated chloride channel family protein
MIEQFTLLRPLWLLAWLPLAGLIWQMLKSSSNSRSWQSIVDAKLLSHLLAGKYQARQAWPTGLVAAIGFICIVALAGPVWEKLPQPVYRQQAAMVIALDLSRSMDASDVKPDRLTRARHKIADILAQRREGQTALVVYAADSFLVTPLTEDSATIMAMLPSLSTDLMPTQGSRADRALLQAFELLANGGVNYGDVLIVSDGLSAHEIIEVEKILGQSTNFRVSILGVGSEAGAPIPLGNGGFLKDAEGSIVVAQMPVGKMASLAANAGGEFQTISADDRDVTRLMDHIERSRFQAETVASDKTADIWREQGPWLVLFILPFVALVFRRGVLFLLPLMLIPISPEAQALEWDELWQNRNQRGEIQFNQGEHEQAAELFSHPGWKASAYYQAGDYEQALEYWNQQDGERAYYNQGNALAKLGRFDQAIEAYDRALDINPQHADASYNKKLIEQQMNQRQQQKDQQQDQQGNEQQQESEQNQSADGDQDEQHSAAKNNQQNSQQQRSEAPAAENSQQQSPREQATEDDRKESEQGSEEQQLAQMEQQMSEQAVDQWLRKIPDDPGGLLRRKFIYQYRNRAENPVEISPW